MVDFVICLGLGILCFYCLLLVKIGSRPVPRPPQLGRFQNGPASCDSTLDFISNQHVHHPSPG